MSEEAIRQILAKYIPPLTHAQVNEIARQIVDYYEHVKVAAERKRIV